MDSDAEKVYLIPYTPSRSQRLIYAPVRGYVGLWDLPDDLTEETELSLKKLGRLPNAGQVIEELRQTAPKDLDRMQKGLPSLNIDLSNGCNMRCIYCYAGRGEGKVRLQTKDNIHKIIAAYFDYLLQLPDQGDGTCPIVFSNDAEPTYAGDLLKYAVKAIRTKAEELGFKPVFSMPTNGAFSRDLRDFIMEYFSEISCSFDGLPAVQNKQRPFLDGSPSFARVYENIKALYESKLKIGFNVVITGYNLNSMRETVDFFDKHFPGSSISFSPVHLAGRALREQKELLIDQQTYDERLMEVLNDSKLTSIKVYTKHGGQNLTPRRHFCASTAKPNWNVNLDGEVFACMEAKQEQLKIGRIDLEKEGQLKLDFERIKSLQALTADRNLKCRACFAKYLCAGGCVIRAEENEASCKAIRDRCAYFINEAYESRNLLKVGRRLFKIDARDQGKEVIKK